MDSDLVEIFYPPTNKTSFVGYAVVGKGQPVLLLHGYAGDKTYWEFWMDHVEKKELPYKCIAIDLIGHGDTSRFDECSVENNIGMCNTILEKMEIDSENLYVVGHSAGGVIGLYRAAVQPTKGVVAIDSPLDPKLPGINSLYQSKMPENEIFEIVKKQAFPGWKEEQIQPYMSIALKSDGKARKEIVDSIDAVKKVVFDLILKQQINSKLAYISPDQGMFTAQAGFLRNSGVEVYSIGGSHCIQVMNPSFFNMILEKALKRLI